MAVPDNATARRYGGGWSCNHGYRQIGTTCAAIVVPVNGHLSGFGNDFECDRLYRKATTLAWR